MCRHIVLLYIWNEETYLTLVGVSHGAVAVVLVLLTIDIRAEVSITHTLSFPSFIPAH